jgi:hypothetical protein
MRIFSSVVYLLPFIGLVPFWSQTNSLPGPIWRGHVKGFAIVAEGRGLFNGQSILRKCAKSLILPKNLSVFAFFEGF